MTRFQHGCAGLILAALGFSGNPAGEWGLPAANAQEQAKESVRPEVGTPLQAARDLMNANKPREALAKVNEADNAANKTPYENYLINHMRGAAASAAGDTETAAKSFEIIIASGRLSAAEQGKLVESMVGTYYRAKDYSKAALWASRYLKEHPNSPQIRQLLAQAYYLNNDFARAAGEMQSRLQGEMQAGRTPTESDLQLLANCYLRLKDNSGYVGALEKLVTYYPKKEYWADVLGRMQRKSGYSGRLDLDVFRLKLATGNVRSAGDYMEMVQLALQAGAATEARKIIEQAFASGMLGTGAEADRHKRLRDLATKTATENQKALAQNEIDAKAASDGTALLNVGFEYVAGGQFDKGLALMEQGIRKGGLKHPQDAKLHVGIAYFLSGQKARAIEVFRTVQGADGTADLARLWALHTARS
jgi:outer membrane protein assembly factor BamD (BamD/ComL family)